MTTPNSGQAANKLINASAPGHSAFSSDQRALAMQQHREGFIASLEVQLKAKHEELLLCKDSVGMLETLMQRAKDAVILKEKELRMVEQQTTIAKNQLRVNVEPDQHPRKCLVLRQRYFPCMLTAFRRGEKGGA
jgi:hypothetical protein